MSSIHTLAEALELERNVLASAAYAIGTVAGSAHRMGLDVATFSAAAGRLSVASDAIAAAVQLLRECGDQMDALDLEQGGH